MSDSKDIYEVLPLSKIAEESNVSEIRIVELVDLGWLQPAYEEKETIFFYQIDVYKIKKVDRLCCDFELPSLAGAIIVDLLDRVEDLEKRLQEK